MIEIFCKNTEKYMQVKGGDTLQQLLTQIKDKIEFRPICARVNNRTENLSYPVFMPKQIEFLPDTVESGRRVYTRSLCMMAYRAVEEEIPGTRLVIEHSVSKGYYCRLFNRDGTLLPVSEENTTKILHNMRCQTSQAIPFVRHEKLTKDVIRIFNRQQLQSMVKLLSGNNTLYTVFYTLGELADTYYGPLAPDTSHIDTFNLVPYKKGFLLLGRDPRHPDQPQQPTVQDKMYQAFTDYLDFNRTIKVSNVGELNEAVDKKQTSNLINVAEAMHNKYIGKIADEIARRNQEGGARIILLAGPSSSGKTTTAKRLAIQLMTNLIVPKVIELDNYFVDRERTPLDEKGEYDYEHIEALDLDLLDRDMQSLLAGEEINLPTYSFELGKRIYKKRPLRLNPGDVLLIEGIHGLNPQLLSHVPEKDKFRVYVSALTTLSIDDHNWIPTTDNRLLRRIVRDNKYRGTSALDTIRRWPSVRRGEERWIFPFQENADAMFNSSLIFELGVMKDYAEPLLRQIPYNVPEYAEAYRLLNFLGCFKSIPTAQVPTTSLLREFLGGSSFHY